MQNFGFYRDLLVIKCYKKNRIGRIDFRSEIHNSDWNSSLSIGHKTRSFCFFSVFIKINFIYLISDWSRNEIMTYLTLNLKLNRINPVDSSEVIEFIELWTLSLTKSLRLCLGFSKNPYINQSIFNREGGLLHPKTWRRNLNHRHHFYLLCTFKNSPRTLKSQVLFVIFVFNQT